LLPLFIGEEICFVEFFAFGLKKTSVVSNIVPSRAAGKPLRDQ
jgi:hypothetical protein